MNLIAKHIDTDLLNVEIHKYIDAICAFTGEKINEGILLKDVISDTFTDFESIKFPSEFVSVDIAKLILPVIPTEKNLNSLRVYSFLATENKLEILKTDSFLPILENPPEPPFIFVVSFSNKKHIAYKARTNYSKDPFYVSTDKGFCLINKNKLSELLEVARRWYTVIPGKENSATQPTYFTKDEIFSGNESISKIREFGIQQYMQDVEILRKFRGTLFAEIVKMSLKKQSL